jgi:ATP-dependent Clp protease protease subunit
MSIDFEKAPPEIVAAYAAKLKAEADAASALARRDQALAVTAEAEAAASAIGLARENYKRAKELVNDQHVRFYRFDDTVTAGTSSDCVDMIAQWARMAKANGEDDCHIKIQFNSPGGSVIDGLALFDEIQHWRRRGIRFTTSTIGMAASMAGILLQAGDKRIMSSEAWVLIHKTSLIAAGDFDSVEDRVKWLDRIQNRILDIFAARAKEAGENGTAEKPITRAQLARGWERKDWWLSSDEALKYGIVDEVR